MGIHKYFYLIVFTAYMRQAADLARESCPDDKKKDLTLSGGRCAIPGNELKLPKSFAAFCEENKDVRAMVENGKGNLQWERDIPPAANLQPGEPGQDRLQEQPGQDHP